MSKEKFYHFLESIFIKYRKVPSLNMLLNFYKEDELQSLNDYISENYREDILIEVYNCERKGNKVVLTTELGTFLLDYVPSYSGVYEDGFSSFINREYNLLHFFGMLFHNDLFYHEDNYDNRLVIDKDSVGKKFVSNKVRLEDYIRAYFIYKMIKFPKYAKRLFLNFVSKDHNTLLDKSIPLEYLNNSEFNNYMYTIVYASGGIYTSKLIEIYDKYYKFDNNLYLLFSCIIISNDCSKIDILKKHLPQFKKFILEESSGLAFSSSGAQVACKFLKSNNLFSLFTEEELIELYKRNPSFYYQEYPELFVSISKKIVNDSPLIRLNSRDNTMIHIQNYDYNLYQDVPISIFKAKQKGKSNSFLEQVFYSNEILVKLYDLYYSTYQKTVVSKNPKKDNLEDFLRCLFILKNLVKIVKNPRFSWEDLEGLFRFKYYLGEEVEQSILRVKEFCRNESLKFYNDVVGLKDNPSELKLYLEQKKIKIDSVYMYLVQEKFLYSKEKGGLLNIINNCNGVSFTILDIVVLLDEMLNADLSIDDFLKEKEIPKKAFQNLYERVIEDNPILYQYIFESLSKDKRKRYIRLLRFAYKVNQTQLTSLEEYNQQFGSVISFYNLLLELENTSLYLVLSEKAKLWADFNPGQIEVKKRKLLNQI